MTATTGAPPTPDERVDAPPSAPAWRLALPAIAIGVVAAVIGLDRRALWLDESFSLGATNQLAETVSGTSGTMIGYYAVLDVWTTVSTSTWWLRLLSTLLMAAALVPLAAVARRIGGPTLAIRATVAAALAVQTTRFAQEARSYALVVLLVSTSWWILVRSVEEADADRLRRQRQILTGLAVALVLAHGLAVLNVLALAVAAALAPDRARAIRTVVPAVVGSLATVAVLLAGGANEVGTWVPGLSLDQLVTAAGASTSPWWWAAVPLAGLVVVGMVDALRPGAGSLDGWLSSIAVVWVAVPVVGLLALSVVRPSFDDRYLIGILPGVALLLARGTLALDTRGTRPARTVGPAAVVALALLVPGQVEVHRDGYDDWRAAADLVAADARAGDALVLPRDFHRTPFEAAWREVPPAAVEPDLVQFDRPLGTVRRHDEPRGPAAADAALAGHDRVWVVVAQEPGVPPGEMDRFLARPEVRDRFRVATRADLGGSVEVVLLDAAG